MIKILSVSLATSLLLVSSAAHAVQFVVRNIEVSEGSVSGTTSATVPVGATVVVDVAFSNNNSDAIGAIGALAFGFDDNLLGFTSGEAVGSATNTSILDLGPSGLLPQGGISNSAGTAGSPNPGGAAAAANRDIGAGDVLQTGTNTVVEWFSGVQSTLPTPTSADTNDLGIDGDLISDGGSSVALIFEALDSGVVEVTFGGDGNLGGVVLGSGEVLGPEINTTVTINVPEAGPLAASLVALASVVGVVAIRRRV
jgi:hypothetical protein